uniref:Uncharacterized protein n=1 Tax=Avena sativa TaxID=4498 RepID=A0ACD5X1B2_AVESA
MLRRTSSASAAMASGYRRREALGACTESLGSESGDVGGGDIDQLPAVVCAGAQEEEEVGAMVEATQTTTPVKRRRKERPLPPAMPRAADAFMRAERRGGRLILTEVVRPAERPREVFRASRADGRLLLRFAEQEDPCEEREAAPESAEAAENGVVVGGCCCNGVEFRQVAAGAGRRVEIGI